MSQVRAAGVLAASVKLSPPSRTRRTASSRTSGGYGGGTLPDIVDFSLPEGHRPVQRQGVRGPLVTPKVASLIELAMSTMSERVADLV